MKTRKPMNRPTKAQLQARVNHYEEALKSLADNLSVNFLEKDDDGEEIGTVDTELVVADLKEILASAPSLEPVVKEALSVAPVTDETETTDDVVVTVDDGEPALV